MGWDEAVSGERGCLPFTCLNTHSLTHSPIQLTCLSTCSLSHTHLLTHPPTQSPTQSPTHLSPFLSFVPLSTGAAPQLLQHLLFL